MDGSWSRWFERQRLHATVRGRMPLVLPGAHGARGRLPNLSLLVTGSPGPTRLRADSGPVPV